MPSNHKAATDFPRWIDTLIAGGWTVPLSERHRGTPEAPREGQGALWCPTNRGRGCLWGDSRPSSSIRGIVALGIALQILQMGQVFCCLINLIFEIWVCLKMLCTPKNPMVLLIIIPIKWLFHWEYTIFSDKPICPENCLFLGIESWCPTWDLNLVTSCVQNLGVHMRSERNHASPA